MKYLSTVFIFLAMTLVGCASNSDALKDYPKYSDEVVKSYTEAVKIKDSVESEVPDYSKDQSYMAAGHQFRLSHASDSKLKGTFRADFNGALRLPYDVSVNVNNKTLSTLREEVMDAYRKFFQKGVESVNFTLVSADYWVEIRGLVQKPGRYLIKASDSLDLVINAAGGVKGDISVDYFTASVKQSKYDFKVLLNNYFDSNAKKEKIRWFGADNIFISKLDSISGGRSEMPFVTILGGVQKPGKVLHQKDGSLYYYIEKSGGLVQGLGYDECYVFRNTPEGVKKINFSFNDPDTIPVIYPHDTVYMNSQVQKKSDLWLQRLGYVATLISTAALLIIAL